MSDLRATPAALGPLLAPTLVAPPAEAATLTANLQLDSDLNPAPDFQDELLEEGDTTSDTGLGLTVSNLVVSDGSATSSLDGDGLYFSRDPDFDDLVQVDLTFGRDTVIDAYDIDFVDLLPGGGGTWPLTGVNGTSGDNPFDAEGRFAFDRGTIPVFLEDEAYTLTHTLLGPNTVQIDELDVTFVAPVPLPAGLVLMLGGLGALGVAGWRRGG